MRTKTKLWFRGLCAGAISGSASAGLSWLGVAGANAAGVSVDLLDGSQLCVILTVGAMTHALMYLKQSPLPPAPTGDSELVDMRKARKP